ncbi:MAG TPA: Gfo/Idh/MocA family oxidoreductase [Blastocatellia bacterium]|nr:Gfo/Idh/MocA family oxidoreductase [Blastocatellia bacterium]
MRTFIRATLIVAISIALVWIGLSSRRTTAQTPEIKVGMIGLDTSHVTAFTKLLNDKSDPNHVPGARVVAAFKGGSPDVESSRTRIERFTAELKDKWGVEIVGSIEELCRKVDAVLLESVDGRPHLSQVRPVFAAKKRVFIDKPFTAGYADAREIVRLSRESGTPFFSSSSLRFATDLQAMKRDEKLGAVLGAFTYGPAPTEPRHPDLFWYGIHAVEMLYTLMGPGCESVTRVHTDGADAVVGKWKDGRIGTMRGIRNGKQDYGAVAFGAKANLATPIPMKSDYRNLLVEVVKFLQTGAPPIPPEETLEMMAFMEAADLSKARGGSPVMLKEVMERRERVTNHRRR